VREQRKKNTLAVLVHNKVWTTKGILSRSEGSKSKAMVSASFQVLICRRRRETCENLESAVGGGARRGAEDEREGPGRRRLIRIGYRGRKRGREKGEG
jgi:hypothetical protein